MAEDRKIAVRTEVKTTVTLSDDDLAALVREHVGAPAKADVTFNCDYDSLREVQVSWTVVDEDAR